MGIFAIPEAIAKGLELANKFFDRWRTREVHDEGAKLHVADEMVASHKGDVDAAKIREDNDGLTDAQLIDSLRQPGPAAADRK